MTGRSSPTTTMETENDDITNRLARSVQLLSNTCSDADLTAGKMSFGGGRPYTPRYVRHAAFDVSSYLSPTAFGSSALDGTDVAQIKKLKEEKTEKQQQSLDDTDVETFDSNIFAASVFCDEFFVILQENPAETQVFAMLDSFVRLCDEKLRALGKLVHKLPSNQSKWRRAMAVKRGLQSEANTWELLHTLYSDRLLRTVDADAIDVELSTVDNAGTRMSEREYVELLYERHSTLRQSQLVVSWLEHVAAKELQDNAYDRFEFFSNRTFCWEATLNTLNEDKRTQSSVTCDRLVTELDPDAPIRQQRSLACLDKENQLSFLKCLFLYIRCGRMDQAVRLCEHYGEHWRSASLQGWRLFHDPNYSDSNGPDKSVRNTDGNPFRDIWKAACWTLSEEECFHPLERAVYGALCGNLDRVLPVCNTWEERLWAHFRSMIDVRIESELRMQWSGRRHGRRGNDAALGQLPAAYWERTATPESIFHELKSSTNAAGENSRCDRFRRIQKYIILDDVDGLLQETYEQVQRGDIDESYDHPYFVRFAAHLVIFLRTVGACCSSKEDLCDAMLEDYVKVLVNQRNLRLVPAYTAKLPPKQQVFWYARFLEGIKNRDEQQLCLRLAEECNLDVALITRTVVENARSKVAVKSGEKETDHEDIVFGGAALGLSRAEITAWDQTKIDVIDWLVFEPVQRLEAMKQANALTRTFLGVHKLDAARAVFNKIPPDSIDTIMKQKQTHAGFSESLAVIKNTTREYLCLQAYLQAQDAFGDWFEHFHHGKPEAPPSPPQPGAPFVERMAHEHRHTQYVADMDRWRHTLDLQTKIAVGKMYNVLLFVDGGWMVDQHLLHNCQERTTAMERLREICLPRVVFLLHYVLYSTERFKEALDLADVVASEQHQLYKVFRKPDLSRFLSKLRDSSLRLLDENLDTMGYSEL